MFPDGRSNLGRVFQRTARTHPEAIGLVDPESDVRYTYEEWADKVAEAGAALAARGVEPGDRIGVVVENRAELATLFWAVQQIGATFVPLNMRAAPDELADVANGVNLDVLFCSAATRETVAGARRALRLDECVFLDQDVPEWATSYETFLESDGVEFDPTFVDQEQTAYILHTSGTTGRPKPVPHSHLSAYVTPKVIAFESRWEHGDSMLAALPLYHMAGLQTLAVSVLCNGTWIAQRDTSIPSVVGTIEDEAPTYFYSVPTVYHDLVEHEAATPDRVGEVEKLLYAGALMTESLQRRVADLFDPDEFINYYGASEMHNLAVCTYLDEKPTCTGRACVDTRLRLVDPDGTDPAATVERGDLGQVIADASSTACFDGYIDRPEANERAFHDGWYFTGDLGYRDADGDLWLVGRVDDMIVSGGENIYPIEVEEELEGHERVGEIAVTGTDHDRWGSVVTAFVVPRTDAASPDYEAVAAELDDYCRRSGDLADFKRPRRYVFVESIPKSSVGKKLRDRLADVDDERRLGVVDR